MNTRPDSALILLEGMADCIHTFPEETQMYWHLLTIQAKDKQYITHTSDSLINHIVEFYEKHDDKAKRMMAYYYQGRVYRDMNDAPQALKAFQRAEELKISDKELLTKVYSQMGYLFAYQGLYDEAIKVRRKSIDIYTYMGKENKASFAFRDIARMHKAKGQADSALYYYQRACQSAIADNDQTIYDGILGELGNCYYSWGKADTAKLLLMKVWNSNVRMNKTHIFPYLGHIYEQEQKWDSAIYCYNRAMKTKDLYKQVSALKGLSRIELQSKGNSPKAVEYLIKALSLNDSIHDRIQTEAIAKINFLYNYQHTEAENNRLQLEQERYEKMLLVAVLLVLTGIMICIWLVISRQKERQKFQRNEERLKQLQEQAVQEKQETIKANGEKIKELEANLVNKTKEKNELEKQMTRLQVEQLKWQNQGIQLSMDQKILAVKALKETKVYSRFRRVSLGETMEIGSNEWSDLRTEINRAYPGFLQNLMELYPKMSLVETRICMLTKLEMQPAHIAKVLGYSRSSVTTARDRLYKKIFGTEGTAEKFIKFIENV